MFVTLGGFPVLNHVYLLFLFALGKYFFAILGD